MFFGKRKKENIKCGNCDSKISEKFSFCPYCGFSFIDPAEEAKEYGMLGRQDIEQIQNNPFGNLGVTDKLIGSLMNTLVKTLDREFKDIEREKTETAEIKAMPNGIRIKISPAKAVKRQVAQLPRGKISDEQLKRFSSLPRTSAKTSVKRLSDRVIYELSVPGINSANDVFVSKLESGYEIKVLGDKVYTNTLPISLPLKNLAVDKNKLFIEFNLEE